MGHTESLLFVHIAYLHVATQVCCQEFVLARFKISRYRLPDLRGDLLAALTVAAMLIPQSMSYALLAGLPPEWGLYAGLVPMVIYSLFGSFYTFMFAPRFATHTHTHTHTQEKMLTHD